MKRRVFVLFSFLIVASLLLAACAAPTKAPVATEAPAATEAPVAPPAAAAPLKIELAFRVVDRAYLPSPAKVAQEIQAELAEVGIQVTLKEMESAAFIDSTAAGNEGFYLLGWNAD